MSVDEILTDREMDIFIGEKVFNFWIDHYDKGYPDDCYYMLMNGDGDSVVDGLHDGERKTEEEAWADCPHFSSDISDAWEALMAMQGLGYSWMIGDSVNEGNFGIDISHRSKKEGVHTEAETVAKAICQAIYLLFQNTESL